MYIREECIREECIREESIREECIREECTREECIREEVNKEEIMREGKREERVTVYIPSLPRVPHLLGRGPVLGREVEFRSLELGVDERGGFVKHDPGAAGEERRVIIKEEL